MGLGKGAAEASPGKTEVLWVLLTAYLITPGPLNWSPISSITLLLFTLHFPQRDLFKLKANCALVSA